MADLEARLVARVGETALCAVPGRGRGTSLARRQLEIGDDQNEQYRRRVPRFNIVLGAMRLLQGGSE